MPEISDIKTDVATQTATLHVAKTLDDAALKAKLDEFAKDNEHIANYEVAN